MIEPGQRLILRTDGGSRGNPGPAGAGVVIESATGKLLAQGRKFLGKITNNQAEYQALILGLQAVKRYQPAAVQVLMDSELVVHQMNGRYQVKDAGLLLLYQEAKQLAATLTAVSFAHVPRSQNHLADALANEAMDAGNQPRTPRP
ncbi:MAG TPA: ribonuclease HI family protein [Ktedonobacterales bacterium]|nr:ribonuclease HI family protein [Ktedonobacterales bacterium]